MHLGTARRIRIGLEVFVGAMAIYGGIRLLADATSFGVKEAWLLGSPFTDYRIPAVGLNVGVGGSSLLGVAGLLRRQSVSAKDCGELTK